MANEPVLKGIFIGRGLPKDTPPSFMAWGFLPFDENGELVVDIPAGADAASYRWGSPALIVGKQNVMPFWDEGVLRKAISSGNFAHPKMQEQIDIWLTENIEGEYLYQKIQEAQGLLTFEDVGLSPQSKNQSNKQVLQPANNGG